MEQAYIRENYTCNPCTGEIRRKKNPWKRIDAPRKDNYRYVCLNDKVYLAHRFVWLYFYGNLPKLLDHVDRNPGNNAIWNLTPTSHSYNHINVNRIPSSSGIVGVTANGGVKPWRVRIGRKTLGYCDTLEEAVMMRKQAESEVLQKALKE